MPEAAASARRVAISEPTTPAAGDSPPEPRRPPTTPCRAAAACRAAQRAADAGPSATTNHRACWSTPPATSGRPEPRRGELCRRHVARDAAGRLVDAAERRRCGRDTDLGIERATGAAYALGAAQRDAADAGAGQESATTSSTPPRPAMAPPTNGAAVPARPADLGQDDLAAEPIDLRVAQRHGHAVPARAPMGGPRRLHADGGVRPCAAAAAIRAHARPQVGAQVAIAEIGEDHHDHALVEVARDASAPAKSAAPDDCPTTTPSVAPSW